MNAPGSKSEKRSQNPGECSTVYEKYKYFLCAREIEKKENKVLKGERERESERIFKTPKNTGIRTQENTTTTSQQEQVTTGKRTLLLELSLSASVGVTKHALRAQGYYSDNTNMVRERGKKKKKKERSLNGNLPMAEEDEMRK